MKKFLKVTMPIVLAILVIASLIWYLFVYDRDFTRDSLLTLARYSETQGNHTLATWFYNIAYTQSGNDDAVAIELAQQYKASGNYTKAEYTLSNAIKDGGGIDLYIALCKTYVEQDKLLDAVNMLDSVTRPDIAQQLQTLRPSAPIALPAPGFYNQYISVTIAAPHGKIYASTKGQYPSVNDAQYSEPLALTDGENKVYTVAIADNGLVSPLAVHGYTIGGVVKELNFADSAIEASIRQHLNVSENKQLYTNDLWTIKEYTVPEKATDLSDLANLAFIEKLTIDPNKSVNINFLSSLTTLIELKINNVTISQEQLQMIGALPNLKKLMLTNCSITSLAPLESSTSLVHLDVSNNTIRDLSPIRGLQNLQELNLSHNAVVDITPLGSLSSIKQLDISYNALTSLAPLSTCTTLISINADVNKINTLGPLESLTQLKIFSAENNQLSNISDLAKCTNLEELNISRNSISDIKMLASLVRLTSLKFSNNTVKELPAFPKDCALVTIDGSNNSITKLDKLKGLKHLNFVNMDYNKKLSSVKPLADCPLLVQVDVYGTKVKDASALTKLNIIVNYKPV